tara:strand:- start:192 stop:902 length:711 start_codon:yes stop_codon:yes gene_type:complete
VARRLVQVNEGLLNHVHVATLLQRCARERLSAQNIISLDTVCAILQREAMSVVGNKFSAKEVSSMIYSLRLFNEKTSGIEVYLQTVLRLLDSCTDPFNAQNIACSFYGLQNFSSEMIQIQAMVSSLVKKIKATDEVNRRVQLLGDQEISMTLFGFRRMCFNPIINEAFHVLALRVDSHKPFESEQAVANSLNGFQNMDCSRPEQSGVNAMLRAIIPKIKKFRGPLSPRGAGSAYMV